MTGRKMVARYVAFACGLFPRGVFMDNKTFTRLIGDLRKDEELFHALVFKPEAALKRLTYLDSSTKTMLRALDPRSFIADAAGLLDRAVGAGSCGPDTTCSCTSSTCGGVTCGGSTCDVTCTDSSCGNTCGDSCGMTTNLEAGFRDLNSLRSGLNLGVHQVWDDAYLAWE